MEEEILDFSGVKSRFAEEDEILDFSRVAAPPPRPTLSEEQSKVRDNPGSTLVTAAPGAGKTEVLIQRHERNEEELVSSLSLTFTVAAAKEIKRRIPGAEASTIHAFCFKHCNYQWSGNYPSLLKDYILNKEKAPYGEVLVDEVQNLSPLMLSVIKAIPKKSLFAVGDPYQSCYIGNWAGNAWDAPALGKRAFEALASMCKDMQIKGNRRSSKEVVSLLERLNHRGLIALGPKKLNRTLITARTHQRLMDLSIKLQEANIPHQLYKRRDAESTKFDTYGTNPLVDLMVLHQCIGTEYKQVFIADWMPPFKGTSEDDVESFNLLYTAAARASEHIYTLERIKGSMCSYLPSSLDVTFERMLSILGA